MDLISIAQVIISIAVIVLILLQERSAGGGAIFGGAGGDSFYQRRRGTERLIFIGTIVLVAAFAILAVVNLLINK
jgi:protein translocase SecG subunit